MAKSDDIQAQMDELDAKRADISDRLAGAASQHAADPAHLLGSDFSAMSTQQYKAFVQPLLNQQRLLNTQYNNLNRTLSRARQDEKTEANAPLVAQRQAASAAKLQDAQQKLAANNLEDQSARAFGLGPKKGIDYVNQQGAFYDPQRGAVAVPDSKTARTAAIKDIKGDANAVKQVQDELQQFKPDGFKGNLNPASFFDNNGYDSTHDDENDTTVYHTPKGDITIPDDDVARLQARYNDHFTTPGETPEPAAGVKYIPTGAFQQANQALETLRGPSGQPDPVERYLNSASIARRAAPAIAQATTPDTSLFGLDAGPTSVPSVDSNNPDLATTVNSLPGSAYLNSGVAPIFGQIAQQNKAVVEIPAKVALSRGGTVSPSDVNAASDIARQTLGADAPPDQLKLAANVALDQIAKKNQSTSSVPYDVASDIGSIVGPQIGTGLKALESANPIMAPANAVGATIMNGYDALKNAGAGLGPLLMGRTQRAQDELEKQNIVDKVRSAISPDAGGVDETAPFLEY